jgi:hypothetical protein
MSVKLTGREIWDAEEPPPEMVWAMCPYLRRGDDCAECPTEEYDGHSEQMVQRGCYTLAAEACRVVAAMQSRSALSQEGVKT